MCRAVNPDLDRLERLIDEDDLDGARRFIGTIADPANAEDVWRLARAWDRLGDLGRAERLFRLAAPESLDALVDLSFVLEEQGREADAERELRAAPAEMESAARVKRGRHYRAVEQPERSIPEYERGVELGERNALRHLAGAFWDLGETDAAERLYRDAPLGRDLQLELDYVLCLEEAGRLDEAEARLRTLVAQDYARAEWVLADFLRNHYPEEAEEEAISHYLGAIMLGNVMEAVTNLGVAWRDQGRPLEAEYALRHTWGEGDRRAGRSLGPLLKLRGAEAAGEVVQRLGDDCDAEDDNAPDVDLPKLPPFDVPDAWEAEAASLREMWARTRGTPPPPDWVTLLQAAQIVCLRERSATAEEIAEHLRIARWTL